MSSICACSLGRLGGCLCGALEGRAVSSLTKWAEKARLPVFSARWDRAPAYVNSARSNSSGEIQRQSRAQCPKVSVYPAFSSFTCLGIEHCCTGHWEARGSKSPFLPLFRHLQWLLLSWIPSLPLSLHNWHVFFMCPSFPSIVRYMGHHWNAHLHEDFLSSSKDCNLTLLCAFLFSVSKRTQSWQGQQKSCCAW